MKVLTTFLILFLSSIGFAQIISINNSAYPQSSLGPEDLIKNVMISSSCSTADNFTFQVSGAPGDLTTKSYGYFKTPPGSIFPFADGVVLTTGRAFPAGNTTNPNRINYKNRVSGDIDLEVALGQSNTYDASFIKFNFTPQVDSIAFRFLMASEEYNQHMECRFADSFAFLLREVGATSYTNLAVLPDGTPVSVRNINDAPACRANTDYFEGYNNIVMDTNYGGRTKALTASSAVTPGVTYEIKLVVADQGDSEWDSAIFIEGGSFNIGGDLGVDRLIVNGNPGCDETPITLDANLSVTGTTFEWFKDGALIAGETSSTLDVSTDGTYSFKAVLVGGCEATDEVVIEFTPPPVITDPPKDILLCETDGNGIEIFDFSANETLVLGSQSAANFPISYHKSQVDAEGNLNPLTLPYQNSLVTETIWMRIADVTQSCFKLVVSFDIEVRSQPTANTPNDLMFCDDADDGDDTNGVLEFDLSTKISEVLGSHLASDYEVNFYYDQAAASAGVAGTEITTPIQNASNPQTVFARLENKLNRDCFDTTSFQLIVHPRPVVSSEITLKQCDIDNDGITSFNLTEANQLISNDHTNETFTYYLTQAKAETALISDQITSPTIYTNPTPVNSTIYARAETIHGCFRTSKVNLFVGVTLLDPITKCNDLISTEYDLTLRKDQITNNDSSIVISYFESQQDLDNNHPIPDPTTYMSTALSKTILVLATGSNGCSFITNLELTTVLYANLNRNPTPIEECEIDNNGFDSFDLRLRENEILNGLDPLDFEISYYENEMDAFSGNTNTILDPKNFENTVVFTQEIYVRVKPKLNDCFIIVPLTIIVNPAPEIDILDRYVICLNKDDQVISPVTQPFLPTPPIDTQLSAAIYSFQWYKGSIEEVNLDPSSVIIPGATNPTYSPISEGTHTVLATNLASGCRIPASTEVVSSYPPETIEVALKSELFSDNNILEVSVVGTGVYEYRIDFGPWQRETLFKNVRIGEHIIYVRDLLNCNEITQKKIVIGSPKFFTPNGDGYHDSWNIIGMSANSSSKIYIFDRYGKLLKQISPTGEGWDGTYNGIQLPSSDYWFVLEYNDLVTGKNRQIKDHFTLKR